MPTINQLASVTQVSGNDQFPLYVNAQGDARRCSVTNLLAYFSDNFASPDYDTIINAPTNSGFNFAIGQQANNVFVILNPTGAFAAGSVTLPPVATCFDGQQIILVSSDEITALTVSGNGASIVGLPAGVDAGGSWTLRFNAAQDTWYCVALGLVAQQALTDLTFLQAGTGAVSRDAQDKMRDMVNVADFGAVGDNLVDDYTAILNAATQAATSGAVLTFDGTKTYRIDQDTLTLPAGLNVQFNGAVLNFTKTQGASVNPAVAMTGPFQADWLRVNVPAGVRRNYGVIATGDNVTIRRINLDSADVQAQLSAAGDYGVKLASGANFICDRISVTNFDRAIVIDSTTDSNIGGVDVTNYVRGLYEVGNTNLFVGASRIQTRSPNASNSPGHNGVLSADGTNNTFADFTVLDAGEEGIRIGGGPQQNVQWARPRVKDAQANGIKILGTNNASPVTGEYQQNLIVSHAIVEDCGTSGGSEDRCGILVQRSVGVQIANPIIRKRDNTYSAVYGILVYACDDVNITNPIVKDAQFSGIYMPTDINGNVADLNRIDIIGGMVSDCAVDGLQITSTASAVISHVNVSGLKMFLNGRRGATLSAGTGGTFVSCFLNGQFYQNVQSTITSTSTGWMLDCFGVENYGSSPTSFASISASNSSRWSNETSFYVRKAGTWTAL